MLMELCDISVSELVTSLKKMATQMGMTGEGAGRLTEFEIAYIIKETNNALVWLHRYDQCVPKFFVWFFKPGRTEVDW